MPKCCRDGPRKTLEKWAFLGVCPQDFPKFSLIRLFSLCFGFCAILAS